jgi:O-antigen/teichoic acid export membrane protein
VIGHFTRLVRRGIHVEAPWGMADQAVSSITNFVMLSLAARQSGLVRFGHFSVAFTVYIVSLWVVRSLVCEPLVIRFTTSDDETRRRAGARATGAALALACLIGLGMAGPGLVAGRWSVAMVAMGLCMPALLVQDTYRYLLMASGRVRSAAVNDGFWLIVQLLGVVLVLWLNAPVEWLLAAFGGGAVAAAILGARQTGVLPNPRSGIDWLRRTADLGLPFLVELTAIYGIAQLALLALAAIGEVAAVGQIRAALLLLSPVTVLCAGLFLVGAPEAVRIRHRNPRQLSGFVLALGSSAALVVIWAVLILMVPDRAGLVLLGNNWLRGTEVLIPVTVMSVATLFVMSGMVGLRALDAARRTLGLRLWAAPVFAVATLVGVKTVGPYGASVGLAVASCLSALLAWIAFRRELATGRRPAQISSEGAGSGAATQ